MVEKQRDIEVTWGPGNVVATYELRIVKSQRSTLTGNAHSTDVAPEPA